MPDEAKPQEHSFASIFMTKSREISVLRALARSNASRYTADVDTPLAYGIYAFMHRVAACGSGAALGMVAVIAVGLCNYFSRHIFEKHRRVAAPTSAGNAA